MCAEAAREARLLGLAATAGAGLCGRGQESCPRSLPVSQLLKACPRSFLCCPPTLRTRTFIHGTLPCTGLLHCSCGSLPCQDSQDCQGASLREGARLEVLGFRYPQQPYYSLALSQRGPSPPTSACPCPCGLCSGGSGRTSGRAPCCPPALIPAFPHLTGPRRTGHAAGAQWEPPPPLRTTAVGLHSLYIALVPFVFT